MSKKYQFAVMPGDFIGKEVVAEEMRVLEVLAKKFGISYLTQDFPQGGEHYVKTGELLTDSSVRELQDFDAIIFGAVGHPELIKGEVEQGILLKIRFDLDQYVNLRPAKLYAGVDVPIKKLHPNLPNGYELIVVREGTSGLYTGKGELRKNAAGDAIFATQVMEYTDVQVDRVDRYAFELARRKKQEMGKDYPVLLGGKSNVLTNVFAALWQPRFERMAKEQYPDVKTFYQHIDALNGPLLISSSPEWFNIVVTSNMFGDILTDLTASLFGGMGIGASACINPEGTSMFEPIHGSSPKDYGKGVVSPIAAILSCVLMLKEIGEVEAGIALEKAVEKVLAAQKIPNFTIHSGVSTRQQADFVIEELMKK